MKIFTSEQILSVLLSEKKYIFNLSILLMVSDVYYYML